MWRKSSHSNGTNCAEVGEWTDWETWRKSSHSSANGQCVECGEWADWETSSFSFSNGNCLAWRKSRHSASNGHCLEVRHGVQVRDSKLGEDSPVLSFTAGAWAQFLAGIR
jgi:Domain of unknown function (DUF397)